MSAVTSPSIKSVTIIRQDALPEAGAAVQSAARLARFLSSISILVTPVNSPDKFFMDVTESQTHNFENMMTENPVESGSAITDHVRKMPDILDVQGWITDTPFSFPPVPFQANRAQQEFQKLLQFFQSREPHFVATSIRIYDSMVPLKLTIGMTPDRGGRIPIAITLKEVRIATLATNIPLIDEAAASVGALPIQQGGTASALPAAA